MHIPDQIPRAEAAAKAKDTPRKPLPFEAGAHGILTIAQRVYSYALAVSSLPPPSLSVLVHTRRVLLPGLATRSLTDCSKCTCTYPPHLPPWPLVP